VSRIYDDHYALVDLTTELPAGSVTALLGPNGAGKSTLLAVLATVLRPTEGEVRFGDRPAADPPADLRRLIGYVGHRTMLYGALTARENLRFYGRLYAVPRLEERVDALLDAVGLSFDKDRPVDGFSRGMAQRLTLARAVLPEPAVLLLDEPLTGLDRAGIETALQLIAERRDAGAIVVMATHDLGAVNGLCDRALVLRRGRAAYDGPVRGDLAGLYEAHTGGARAGRAG
jgi:heme exporter protein A